MRHHPALDAALPAQVAATIRLRMKDGSVHEVAHLRSPIVEPAEGLPCAWISQPHAGPLLEKFATLTAHRASEAQAIQRLLLGPLAGAWRP